MLRPTRLALTLTIAVALSAGLLTSSTTQATAADTGTLTGKVVRIADGDTVTLLDAANQQHKIRLWGIDAPEIGHGRRRPGQPFGTNAKDALGDKVHEKQVTVETHGTDKYGRTLGTIFIDGKNVNQEMVAEGMAWWYERYAKRAAELEEAEKKARSAGRGLWADKEPVPPWDWRRTAKEMQGAGGRGKVN